MSHRTILFGYTYDNGRIVVDNLAADIVKEIFSQYLENKSLLEISKMLNKLHIEYQPGVVNWNKARIKRILEDDRYTGNESYPQIIDAETMMRVNGIKESKSTQQGVNRKTDIYFIGSYVRCPHCGEQMNRNVDKRNDIKCRWKCQNTICRETIAKEDDEFIKEIIGELNFLIMNPEAIMQIEIGNRDGESVHIIENEINHMMDYGHSDKNEIKVKLLEWISTKYVHLDAAKYISQKLKSLFSIRQPSKHFQTDLFRRAVECVSFDANEIAVIRLINGQEIGKESLHESACKEGQDHRGDQERQRDYNGKVSTKAGGSLLPSIDTAGRTA